MTCGALDALLVRKEADIALDALSRRKEADIALDALSRRFGEVRHT